ncbi:hypothetical protein VNO80_10471 [Phaseolus coccineus]|uniref:Uncharacterized protein n=1 Tax=Phaseolus coccineus TaxID=3886 RepID=A0AAN9N874_PHACN
MASPFSSSSKTHPPFNFATWEREARLANDDEARLANDDFCRRKVKLEALKEGAEKALKFLLSETPEQTPPPQPNHDLLEKRILEKTQEIISRALFIERHK